MKKLFISCPMRGRTEENIRNSMERMHKMAEVYFDQELEVIPTYIPERAPDTAKNRRVWYLGESIKLMAEADYFIGIQYSEVFKGCQIENEVAHYYQIPRFQVDLAMMPDAVDVERHYWGNLVKEEKAHELRSN